LNLPVSENDSRATFRLTLVIAGCVIFMLHLHGVPGGEAFRAGNF